MRANSPMRIRDLALEIIDALSLDRTQVSSITFQRLSPNNQGARIEVQTVTQDAVRGVVKGEESFAMFSRPVYWKPWRRGALERLQLVSVERTEDDS